MDGSGPAVGLSRPSGRPGHSVMVTVGHPPGAYSRPAGEPGGLAWVIVALDTWAKDGAVETRRTYLISTAFFVLLAAAAVALVLLR